MEDKQTNQQNEKEAMVNTAPLEEMASLESLPMAELKKRVVELGFSGDLGVYNSKAQIVGLITFLQSKTFTKPVIDDPKKDVENYTSKRKVMYDLLSKQPKKTIFLPLEGKETRGSIKVAYPDGKRVHLQDQAYTIRGDERVEQVGTCFPVTLNGCKTLVPKGIAVEVPLYVHDTLSRSFNMTASAGEAYKIERSKEIEDALS